MHLGIGREKGIALYPLILKGGEEGGKTVISSSTEGRGREEAKPLYHPTLRGRERGGNTLISFYSLHLGIGREEGRP